MTTQDISTTPTPLGTVLRPGDFNATGTPPHENDLLNREKEVARLVRLLRSTHGHFCIALTGDWGTGKSCTLKMVEATLKESGVRCHMFDAWENDFAGDPIIPLLRALADAMSADANQRTKLFQAGFSHMKAAAHGALKDAAAICQASNTLEGLMNGSGDISATVSASEVWEAHEEALHARTAIEELLRESSEHRSTSEPIVVIIDELDRCRPSFAIELLERVKHFLSSESVTFVIGVNISAAAKTVEGFYGPGFDGREYLDRFFDLTYSLPVCSSRTLIEHEINRLWPAPVGNVDVREHLRDAICESVDLLGLPVRKTVKLIGDVRIAYTELSDSYLTLLPAAAQLIALSYADRNKFASVNKMLHTAGQPGTPWREKEHESVGGRFLYVVLCGLSRSRRLYLTSGFGNSDENGVVKDKALATAESIVSGVLYLQRVFESDNPEQLVDVRDALKMAVQMRQH